MKTTSWYMNREDRSLRAKDFWLSPYFSIRSTLYHPKNDRSLVPRVLAFSFLTIATVTLGLEYLPSPNTFQVMLLSPVIYFFTEALGGLGQILFFKAPSFPIHRSPYLATSLSNFWGRDWNVWIQDWLRDISRANGKARRSKRILIVFFISGLFHEAMVNLPYWILYGKSYFGSMLAYFCIQALALWIDKKFVSKAPRSLRRIYMWAAIVLPSPLFVNVPLLTFFGFTQ